MGVFLGAADVLLVVVAESILGFFGAGWAPLIPFDLLWLAPFAVLVPELIILSWFPRRFPAVGRVGISPLGLRLILPLRRETIVWPDVRGVGTDRIRLSIGAGTRTFRLTPRQGQRIAHFLGRA